MSAPTKSPRKPDSDKRPRPGPSMPKVREVTYSTTAGPSREITHGDPLGEDQLSGSQTTGTTTAPAAFRDAQWGKPSHKKVKTEKPPSEPSSSSDEEQDDPIPQGSVKRRTMVSFTGKPSEIDNVLTHCTASFAADGITSDERKCGYLASLFKGPALTWLTNTLKDTPDLLESYSDFTTTLRGAFALSKEAQAGQQARQLASLRQRKSVQDYAMLFKPLAKSTSLSDEVAAATFIKGLKPHIQRALIASGNKDTLDAAIEESIRIDSELYNLRRQGGYQGRSSNSKTSYPGRNKKGQFVKIKKEYDD